MITGFERETHDLTEAELKIAKPIAAGLMTKIGKESATTSNQICTAMNRIKDQEGWPNLTGPRLRKIINYLRTTGKIKNLIATSDGYYVAKTQEEINDYKKSLTERIAAIQAVHDSFQGPTMPTTDEFMKEINTIAQEYAEKKTGCECMGIPFADAAGLCLACRKKIKS